jgi:hypothetical protein
MKNTKELLKDAKVKVENLGTCLKRSGVILDLSFGGGRNSYKVPLKMFGVKEEKLSEGGKEFFERHAKDGTITLVPEEESKKFRAIEAKTHKKLREIAIGYNGRFVPVEDFEDFVEYFEKSKKEYMDRRDELVENYPNMIARFKEILALSLSDLDVQDAKEEFSEIMRKIPSQAVFADSFRADLSVSLLPTMNDFGNLEIDEDTKKTISKQYEELGKNLIGDSTVSVLQEAVDSLSSVINVYNKSGKLHHTVIKSLKSCVVKMGRRNVFGNNKLDSIKANIKELVDSDSDILVQQSEMLLSEIYVYSKELGVEEKIDLSKVSLTPERLESLYNLYN